MMEKEHFTNAELWDILHDFPMDAKITDRDKDLGYENWVREVSLVVEPDGTKRIVFIFSN